MTFLLPLGLLALLTLPIIVLLHLLRERRRRMAVPSLLHWQNLPRKPEGQRIRRLPLTLLLLLHLLAAALIGLALGQPQLAGALGGAPRQTAIIIDTSTSMAARDGASTRFAQARERARAALNGLSGSDRAILIAAGPTARVVASGGAADAAGLQQALDQLRPGGTGADLAGALTLAEAAFDQQRARQVLVITDGGLPSAPERTIAAPLDWQQVGSEQPNRAIVAFAARPSGANIQLYARAANYGPTPIQTTIGLYGDDQALGTRDIAIAAGSETELTWTLPARYSWLRAALDGRDALPQDDNGFLNLAQTRQIKALLVSDKPEALRRALAAVPGISMTVVAPSSYSPAPAAPADLTVFDGFLPQAWPEGAVLAINPPPSNTLIPVAQRSASPSVGELVRRGALLEGLSLEGVRFGPTRAVTPLDWAETQLAVGEMPLILRGRSGAHEIAIWTFDPAAGNLPTRLAFPLLVARTVRDLTPPALPASILAGARLTLRPDPRASEVDLSGPGSMRATVAVSHTAEIDTLTQPGFYRVEERAAGEIVFRGQVAVNAGAAIESDLRSRPAPAIVGAAQSSAGAPQREMRDIWPWLALGALAVLMLEWGYIHR
ncbi:MAG TPA: VWA domain-containing protein [Roseiflexaceae bacterium]|nr:VWA domain-containing protein [Roseiflexaceae bacterium]